MEAAPKEHIVLEVSTPTRPGRLEAPLAPQPPARQPGLLRQLSNGLLPGGATKLFSCQICFENNDVSTAVTLPCGHRFCTECFAAYLHNKVTDGQVRLTCFHTESAPGSRPCGRAIPDTVVEPLLSSEDLAKWRRFSANLNNPNSRQCPKCDHTMTGSPGHPQMTCEKCGAEFCFTHSLAHVGRGCEEYEREQLLEQKLSRDLVSSLAKPCPNPNCRIPIVKSTGCNAMKCTRCGTGFCWLCGKECDTSEMPRHFAWWNVAGCPNKQMAGTRPGVCGGNFICTLLLLLLLGPPALALAAATFVLVFPLQLLCGCGGPNGGRPTAKESFASLLSLWGTLLVCPLYTALLLVVFAVLSPCILLGLCVRCCAFMRAQRPEE